MSRIISFDHHPDFAGWHDTKSDNEHVRDTMPKRSKVGLLVCCVAGAWLVFLSPVLLLN